VRNAIKLSAAAILALGLAQPALADQAETKGGIKIKTDDGRFEANVGGRIHFDVNVFDEDGDSFGALAAGSELTPDNSSAYLRRVYLTLKGKLYGWNYKVESDFANNTQSGATTTAFQDITMSTEFLGGEIIFGQFKPYRSLEDLTSSNDLLMIERPYTSSNGVFAGREFQQGVGYKLAVTEKILLEASLYSMRSSTSVANAGTGYNARFAWAPMMDDGKVLHLGINYSNENFQDSSAAPPGTAVNVAETQSYAGRRGPTLNIGSTAGSDAATTVGLEAAAVFGPFFVQSEWVSSKLGQDTASDQTVDAAYVQVAFELTGEHKPYKPADGVFGSVKPLGESGAWELTARFDTASNDDKPVGGCSVTTTAAAAAVALTGSDKCEATSTTIGLNWYANPNARFMLNYVKGKADAGAAGTDEPSAIVVRTQLSF
jgi:phosphate-selective porin OprO/OprP